MLAYYILAAVPLMYLGAGYSFKGVNKKKINNYAAILFFAILAFMLALRHETVGTDTPSYVLRFSYMCNTSLSAALNSLDIEPAYLVLNKLIALFTHNKQIFIAVTSLITIIPIAYFYIKNSDNLILALSLFLVMPTFQMMFSGIRQSISMALVIPAYYCVKRKKLLLFLVIVGVAFLFHQSSFIMILLYPVFHLKINAKNSWLSIPLIGVMYVFNQQIFGFVIRFMGDKYEERYGEAEGTGSVTMLLLFIILALFAFVATDENKMDYETSGLRNILLLTVILQLFVPLNPVAMRMNYYFLIFLPVCMSKIVNKYRDTDKNIVKYITVGMCIFFLWFFFNNGHGAMYTNVGLHIYPYIPFWKQAF